MNYSPSAIRKFINIGFNDEEVEVFCFDHFPEVRDNFAGGMTKGQKILALIDHCQSRGQMDKLLRALEQERPTRYQGEFSFFGELNAPTVQNVSQLPRDLAVTTIIWEKDGKQMVRVRAGEFLYGENSMSITLPDYWIDRTPVTCAEYAQFLADTKHRAPNNWIQEGSVPPNDMADHPVVEVSFLDVVAYAEWAGKRLPTEKEWEKAARGTDGRKHPWGNQEPDLTLCNFAMNEDGTTPVGKYSPQGDSPFNCVDMSGNVWEWTSSLFDDEERARVLRGAGWATEDKRMLRCTARYRGHPELTRNYLGFRLSVSLEGEGDRP